MNTPALPKQAGSSRDALRAVRNTGHFCLAVLLTVWIVCALIWGTPYTGAWQLVLAHLFGGRPLNASVGMTLGFGRGFVLFQACMQDLIISLYLYPCIVTGYRIAARWPLVGTALRNTHHLAVSHKSRIAPYGVAGLALFVFLPLWGTGPYVGVAAGYLMGFGIFRTFVTVTAGNIIAVAFWIGAFDVINDELAEINRNLPWAAAALILFASLAATVWSARRKRRNAARAGAPGNEET